jgi:prepilin-type N-terminal cleavage/methylation domain-containing protein
MRRLPTYRSARARGGQKPNGFTLVELLVVVTILGLLMAMIFPAANGVFEAARKLQCNNKIAGLARIISVYQSNNGRYPGLVDAGQEARDRPPSRMTWCTQLLSLLEQKDIYSSWYDPKPGTEQQRVGEVDQFICPSDPADDQTTTQHLSYAINAGSSKDAKGGVKANVANGIAFNRYVTQGAPPYKVLPTHVINGLDKVILLGENVQAWNWGDKRFPGATAADPYDGKNPKSAEEAQRWTGLVWDTTMTINENEGGEQPSEAPDKNWARPSSKHPEGTHVAMCSGSARFVSDGVNLVVYQKMITSNQQKSDLPPAIKSTPIREGDF